MRSRWFLLSFRYHQRRIKHEDIYCVHRRSVRFSVTDIALQPNQHRLRWTSTTFSHIHPSASYVVTFVSLHVHHIYLALVVRPWDCPVARQWARHLWSHAREWLHGCATASKTRHNCHPLCVSPGTARYMFSVQAKLEGCHVCNAAFKHAVRERTTRVQASTRRDGETLETEISGNSVRTRQ